MKKKKKIREKKFYLSDLVLLPVCIIFLYPFYYMVINTFKTMSEMSFSPTAFPAQLFLDNYKDILTNLQIYRAFGITAVITVCSVLAIVDGCSIPMVFFRIVFPLMKPITSTSVIFNTMWIWNDFIAPNIFLSTRSKGTIVLEIFRAKGQFSVDWPRFMTLSVVAIFPVVVFYLLMQKNIIKGLTAGAVKG